MADDDGMRQCPYCKEDIKSEAIKCKHCGSRVEAARPAHGGICPYCKEEIHPDALRCKHCHSTLTSSHTGFGGSGDTVEKAGSGGCGCAECSKHDPQAIAAAIIASGGFGAGQSPAGGAYGMKPMLRNIGLGGTSGLRTTGGLLDCYSVCSGSILWCICTMRGTGWISAFPCGSCIDDGGVLA
jgi:hypothetical protein